jgi:hypothetical protein
MRKFLTSVGTLVATASLLLLPVSAHGQAGDGAGACPSAATEELTHAGTFEPGNLCEFDFGASVRHGSLDPTPANAAAGAWSVTGSYDGSGANGFARVGWQVRYEAGDTVRFGASFLLTDTLPCWAMLARWDNYALYGPGGDVGGIELEGGEFRLVRTNYDGSNYRRLSPSVRVPLDRWFSIEVVQRLGTAGATSDLYLDGEHVGGSTAANSRGRPIRNIRFGFVAVAAQCTPASSFLMDDVFAT